MSARPRCRCEHALGRNCPVHARRKKMLMIFVGALLFTESASGNVPLARHVHRPNPSLVGHTEDEVQHDVRRSATEPGTTAITLARTRRCRLESPETHPLKASDQQSASPPPANGSSAGWPADARDPRPRVDGRCGRSFECHWRGRDQRRTIRCRQPRRLPMIPTVTCLGLRVDCEQVGVEAALVGSHLLGLA
jgi:hypothetical protein